MTQKIDIIKILVLIIFFLSLFGVLESITRYKEGIHSVDVGKNLEYIGCITGTEFIDIGNDYQIRTGNQLYILGLNQTDGAFYMLLFYSLVFGASLCDLIRRYLK